MNDEKKSFQSQASDSDTRRETFDVSVIKEVLGALGKHLPSNQIYSNLLLFLVVFLAFFTIVAKACSTLNYFTDATNKINNVFNQGKFPYTSVPLIFCIIGFLISRFKICWKKKKNSSTNALEKTTQQKILIALFWSLLIILAITPTWPIYASKFGFIVPSVKSVRGRICYKDGPLCFPVDDVTVVLGNASLQTPTDVEGFFKFDDVVSENPDIYLNYDGKKIYLNKSEGPNYFVIPRLTERAVISRGVNLKKWTITEIKSQDIVFKTQSSDKKSKSSKRKVVSVKAKQSITLKIPQAASGLYINILAVRRSLFLGQTNIAGIPGAMRVSGGRTDEISFESQSSQNQRSQTWEYPISEIEKRKGKANIVISAAFAFQSYGSPHKVANSSVQGLRASYRFEK